VQGSAAYFSNYSTKYGSILTWKSSADRRNKVKYWVATFYVGGGLGAINGLGDRVIRAPLRQDFYRRKNVLPAEI